MVCGLRPTGHKFGLYAPVPAEGSEAAQVEYAAGRQAAVAALEDAIAGWTPREALARGQRCTATSEGIVAGGVPIGTPAFVRATAHTAVAGFQHAHDELRELRDVQCAYLLLRYSLSVRFHHLLRTVGSEMGPGFDPQGPRWAHDSQVARSLCSLLVDPLLADDERRARIGQFVLGTEAWDQASLPARRGGLGLARAVDLWPAARLACASAVLPFLREHAAAFALSPADLSTASALPYFTGLQFALDTLRQQSPTAAIRYSDLTSLLSGSPITQHDLAEGVFERQFTGLLGRLQTARDQARLLSAGGLCAGHWLGVWPISRLGTARARHYQLALALRLGLPLPELAADPVSGLRPACGGCGMLHDAFGWHPGQCRAGNRRGLWTVRHDAVETMLVYVLRRLGLQGVLVVSRGAGNWFGAAAARTDGRPGYRRADVVARGYHGDGRHAFLDVAVTDSGVGRALDATPSSATSSGVAAEMRAAQKVGKYGALAAQVSSSFHPAVIERYGACCEALWGFLRTAAGDRDRDPLRHDDVTFSHSSRGTYAAGMLVFAAVIGDAALIAEVIDVDTHGRDPRAVPGAPAPPRADAGAFSSSLPPTQREIEGAGGEMWYEARHIGAGRAA